jgi:MraZ protein
MFVLWDQVVYNYTQVGHGGKLVEICLMNNMLIGEYTHTLDDKNRISLPVKFRKEMGKRVVVAPGLDLCLSIFTDKEWNKISEKLSESSMLQVDNRSFSRFMFGQAVEIDVDANGRILIPDNLKGRSALGSKVTVIGVQNRVEIWNEERWKEYKKIVESQADALAEKLGQIGVL